MPDGRIAGRRALVTGASSGIGAAIARALAQRGADVVLVARRRERLDALAEELRALDVQVQVEAMDLLRSGAIDDLLARTEGRGLPIDVLVNNAGAGYYETFVDSTWDTVHRLVELNIISLTHLSHAFLPKMIERGRGHLLNVASIGAYTPTPMFATYTATKAYVRNLTEAIAYELRGTGVHATCVNPGPTQTEFTEHANQVTTKTAELFMMSSERCAEIAVEAMLAARPNVITGWLNAVAMWLLRFVPRSMYPMLAHRAMSRGVHKA